MLTGRQMTTILELQMNFFSPAERDDNLTFDPRVLFSRIYLKQFCDPRTYLCVLHRTRIQLTLI